MAVSIGRNFHIIHMTDDLDELDSWYYRVFSCQRFMPDSYMPAEIRDASLVLIGDLCIETLAPAFRVEGWEKMPLGRFQTRLGKRFHSLAWYVDDGIHELFHRLRDAEIRCYGTGGVVLDRDPPEGAFFTHPRDTGTQLEFVPTMTPEDALRDPRLQPGWTPVWWADNHPLEILKFSHATVTTPSLDELRATYLDVVGATLVAEADRPAQGARSAFVLVGDLLVELTEPLDEATPLAEDLRTYGSSLYSVSYKVRDLDRAEAHLVSKGVAIASRDDDTLIADPATTHGCVMAFTTESIPGDPRPDWTECDGPPPIRALTDG